MSLIDCAKEITVWRGVNYYYEEKVKNLKEIGLGVFTADVWGSEPKPYSVKVNAVNPWESTCNCPYASGQRIVCKHMVAAYFTAFPEHLDLFARKYMDGPVIEDLEEKELFEKVQLRVAMMSKPELRQALLEQLCFSSNDHMEKFLRDHVRLEDYE